MGGLSGAVATQGLLRPSAVAQMMTSQAIRAKGPVRELSNDAQGFYLAVDPADSASVVSEGGFSVSCAAVGVLTNAASLTADRGSSHVGSGTPGAIIAAYQRWGMQLCEHLEGEFAFALFDERTGTLMLARDRMGIKPLYYYVGDDCVLFATLPSSILSSEKCTRTVRWESLPAILQPRLAAAGETPVDGMFEVKPGHMVLMNAGAIEERRYWTLGGDAHTDSFEETVARVRHLLEEAVRSRAEGADVAMLSGGLDSTSVAAFAQQLRGDQRAGSLSTFCLAFDTDQAHFVANDLRPDLDTPFAQEAADALGTRHHTVTVSLQQLTDSVPSTRSARGLPGWGQFDASMYLLMKRMSELSSVGLSGEAADEIFGGYPYFFDQALLQRDTFPWLGDGEKVSDFLTDEVKGRAHPQDVERERYTEMLRDMPRVEGESAADARVREVMYLGMQGPLSVVLERKERMGAAAGVEVRIPFCDHRLVEYVWGVPWSMKSRGGVKGLLKEAVRGVVPEVALRRRKSAYPHVQNPVHDKQLVEAARRVVRDSGSSVGQLFDGVQFSGFLDRVEEGRVGRMLPGGSSAAGLLIQLVEFDAWVRSFGLTIR